MDKLKHTRPFHTQNELTLQLNKEEEKLCVVNCLKEYITKTEDIRNGNINCSCHMSNPVSRWMKAVLVQAGINHFEPHSFRGAAASTMAKSGMTLEDILKKAESDLLLLLYYPPCLLFYLFGPNGQHAVCLWTQLNHYFTIYTLTSQCKPNTLPIFLHNCLLYLSFTTTQASSVKLGHNRMGWVREWEDTGAVSSLLNTLSASSARSYTSGGGWAKLRLSSLMIEDQHDSSA